MRFLYVLSLFVLRFCFLIHAQQPYVGKATTNCSNTADSALGYSCNGQNRTCQAYLIFRSQPPYTTVTSISNLLGSNPSQLSEINSVPLDASFETDKLVIAPVTCSCSGQYYQSNTAYAVQFENTYFLIANDTYQGLSTCQAIQDQNRVNGTGNIFRGERITVPLRCACPTKNQTDIGINYLVSYIVTWNDYVLTISERFGADTATTLEANGLSFQNSNIYPFTTLLVPVQFPPNISQTVASPPPPNSPTSLPPSSNTPGSNGSSKKAWIYVVVGILGGVFLTLISGIIIFMAFFRKRKDKSDLEIVSESFEAVEKPLNKKLDEGSHSFLERMSSIGQSLISYKFEELQAATGNFSPSCWIKGSVYRGDFNGDLAAIKKTNGDVSKEINLLNKLNHNNLIRLSGVCFNEGTWYLVYEYAANGPLSDWIHHSNDGKKFLNWRKRVEIALDVARGLNYLHSFTSPPHVHKDINSSNVLLDAEFNAKIANLAMARSTEGEGGEFALTRHIVGTQGYMAPEYLENGLVSTKLDVYAFGILMLEIITGKEVAELYTEGNVNLSDKLSIVLADENGHDSFKQFIDPTMEGKFPVELAIFMVRLIASCLNMNPSARPSMDEIVQALSRIFAASTASELSNNFSANVSSSSFYGRA